jgi:hypothetical protein
MGYEIYCRGCAPVPTLDLRAAWGLPLYVQPTDFLNRRPSHVSKHLPPRGSELLPPNNAFHSTIIPHPSSL